MFIAALQNGDEGEENVMINLNKVSAIKKCGDLIYQVELEGNEYFITNEVYEAIIALQAK